MATHSQTTVLKQWPAAVKQKARNSSILEIEQAKEHSKTKHGSATNTNTTYDGYIRRGKQWLAGLVKDVEQEDELEHPRGCPANGTPQERSSGEQDIEIEGGRAQKRRKL